MKKTILALSMLSLIFVSCKKDEDDEPVTPTKENLTGSFKKTGHVVAGVNIFNNSDPSMNMYEACERDDIYTFNANGTYTRTEGGAVCTPSRTENGTWSLSGSTMTVNGDQNMVESFDCKTLILVNTDTNIAGDRLKFTFIKQ